MKNVEYPCTACAKQLKKCDANYLRCRIWRAWFHDCWAGLTGGAVEWAKRKAWLDLMIQRSTWMEEER